MSGSPVPWTLTAAKPSTASPCTSTFAILPCSFRKCCVFVKSYWIASRDHSWWCFALTAFPLEKISAAFLSVFVHIVRTYSTLKGSFFFSFFFSFYKSPVFCCVTFAAGEAEEMYALYVSDGHCIWISVFWLGCGVSVAVSLFQVSICLWKLSVYILSIVVCTYIKKINLFWLKYAVCPCKKNIRHLKLLLAVGPHDSAGVATSSIPWK